MTLAKVSALRSKDPITKVGACLVNEDKRVVALGYNGMPKGNDDAFPWGKEGLYDHDRKYAYVIHAELNAILNATVPLKEIKLYTTLFPCSNCSKTIAQTGIKEIIFEESAKMQSEDFMIAKKILDQSKITYRQVTKIKLSVE